MSTPRARQRDEAERDALVLRMRSEGATFLAIAQAIGADDGRSGMHAWQMAVRRLSENAQPWEPDLSDPSIVPWAAGFFDGEGCVYAAEGINRGYRRFVFLVTVSQATRAPLDVLMNRWGGSVRFQKRTKAWHRDQWMWNIRGEEAATFLGDVLPHLRVKSDVARAVLPVIFRTHQKGVRYRDEEIVAMRAAISTIRGANRRGEKAA